MTGQELQKLRAKHGVSQYEVAAYLGYVVNGKPNRSMIARFENDYAKINPRVALALVSFFESIESASTQLGRKLDEKDRQQI